MIFSTIKSSLLYIISMDIVLGAIAVWLQSFGNMASNLVSFFVACAGLVLSIYTIVHIRVKIKGNRLDNKLKELDIQAKEKSNKIIK